MKYTPLSSPCPQSSSPRHVLVAGTIRAAATDVFE
jgi:hypothetical protein